MLQGCNMQVAIQSNRRHKEVHKPFCQGRQAEQADTSMQCMLLKNKCCRHGHSQNKLHDGRGIWASKSTMKASTTCRLIKHNIELTKHSNARPRTSTQWFPNKHLPSVLELPDRQHDRRASHLTSATKL
jgi:hypothetical protein